VNAVAATYKDTPPYSYLLALALGLSGLPIIYALASYGSYSPLVTMACLAVLNAVPGAAFGLVWPDIKWRWGVWLCGVPAVVASFFAPSAWFMAGWLAMTVLPACAGAYATAQLHLRYVRIDDPDKVPLIRGGREVETIAARAVHREELI
jgi:hypothetical protein